MGAKNFNNTEKKKKKKKKKKMKKEEEEGRGAQNASVARFGGGNDKGGEKKVITDTRFASVHSDPRFQNVPKQKSKVSIDSRFDRMFTDKSFALSSAPSDKRGKLKPKPMTKKQKYDSNPLRHYYRIEEEEKSKDTDEEESDEEDSEEVEEESVKDRLALNKLGDESDDSDQSGREDDDVESGDSENSTDTDDEDGGGVYTDDEPAVGEESVPVIDEETHRLAIVNMDWRHVRKIDRRREMEDSNSEDDIPPTVTSRAAKQMTTVSTHCFGNSTDSFSIKIIESMKEEYGMFVWPCSNILAEYVWQQRPRFSGTSVVELGAGTSLPGLVAAKMGSDVTLTDDSNRLEVLDNMRRVCNLNELHCNVMGLTWGVWDEPVFDLRPKIILGADVLYDTRAFDDLFATVTFLLQNSPDSVFITTYHNRSGHYLIEFLLVKWGLKCVKLLDGFSFIPSSKASGLSGNIQLAEIALQK